MEWETMVITEMNEVRSVRRYEMTYLRKEDVFLHKDTKYHTGNTHPSAEKFI